MNLIYGDELDKFKEIITELEELRITGMKGILGVEIKDHEQFLYDKEGKKHVKTVPVIYTTGSNFSELSKYSYLIDIYKSYTNDIYEVYLKLGIGAAKTLLFEEIYSIFESNGISISIDNVSLLVSKMTADGILAPISRNGLKLSKSSTLQKVSFEMPLTYILEASKVGANENVRGTSDNIFFAQPITGATTSFDLCMAL